MKKLFSVLAIAATLAACNSGGTATEEKKDTTAVAPVATDAAPATTAPADTMAAKPASTDAAPATTAK